MNTPSFSVEKIDAPLGAVVRGLDLRQPMDIETLKALRQTWLDHQLLVMPDQAIAIKDLERFSAEH